MVFGFVEHSAFASPTAPVPWQPVKPERFATRPPSGLRVTWLGHSTVLVEIDGYRVLTDPVWGERPSPVDWLGPSRWYPPPLALEDLPPLDAIVLSHDHYDHLDYPTIHALRDLDTRWFAPLGVDAHLVYWGVPAERITTVDWGDAHSLDPPRAATGTVAEEHRLVVHATESRHASGRQVFDQNATLWAGYALVGPEHRVFYSGDTGLFPNMKTIGQTLGPFDLTMIEVGAYHRAWPDWHIGPEQAVEAHEWLRGEVLLPVHWGLFDLAMHSWTEPIERTLAAARQRSARVVTPRPGVSFDPTAPPAIERWWPADVPWQTADEHPIISTKVDSRR
jgi:L-ascorbate metabolism protein UlaG (beta-lactamase superfamily)